MTSKNHASRPAFALRVAGDAVDLARVSACASELELRAAWAHWSPAEASVDLVVLPGASQGSAALERLLAWRGARALPRIVAFGAWPSPESRRAALVAGADAVASSEDELAEALLAQTRTIEHLRFVDSVLVELGAAYAVVGPDGSAVAEASGAASSGLGASPTLSPVDDDPEGLAREAAELAADAGDPAARIQRRLTLSDGFGERVFGRTVVALETPRGRRALSVHLDLGDRLELERQALTGQKVAAVSKLQASLVHDLNNAFCVISSCGELLLDGLPSGDPGREDASEILRAITRANALVQRMSAFAKNLGSRPARVNVVELVRRADALLRRAHSDRVELSLGLRSDDATALTDAPLLEQAIVDLVGAATTTGASRASIAIDVEERGAEVLVVLTATALGDGAEPAWAHVATEDLAAVRALVQRTGTRVSTDPSGARIELALRRAPERVPGTKLARARLHAGRPETILVVDDDSAVRASASRVLKVLGYRVHVARCVADARAVVAANAIDAVATDIMLPDGTGFELVEALRRERASLGVLLFSGYLDSELGPTPADAVFMAKPFTTLDLASSLRSALDGAPRDDR